MPPADAEGGPATRFNASAVLAPGVERRLRRMPRLVRQAITLVWRAAPREFVVSSGLQLAAGVATAGQLLIAKRLLDAVLAAGQGVSVAAVLPELTAFGLLTAFTAFAALAQGEQQRLLAELVGRHATTQVIAAASAAELIAYEDPAFHDRLQRATVNSVARPLQMASGMLGILGSGFAIAGIAAAVALIEPLFLALLLAAYLPTWYLTRRASRLVHDFAMRETERDRRRNYLLRVLTHREHAQEVRSFELAGPLGRRHDRLYGERIAHLRQVARRRLAFGAVGTLVTTGLTVVTVVVLVWFVGAGRMSVAQAGAAAGAVVLLGARLRRLSASAGRLYEASLFLEDFTGFVASLPAAPGTAGAAPAPVHCSVRRAERVWFAYPSRTSATLRDVSLEIRDGEVVALVGENGSGKTTLAKLLAGLYNPYRGRVRWDDTDVATCDPGSLRASVAVVFQDFARYHLTARENIAVGRPERPDAGGGVVGAARSAGAHDYLAELPDGYETWLGSEFWGGSDLSAGQWQRVALARAFYRDAPLLILDEPSAALDPRAERDLFDQVRKLYAGRSVLLISHRFSTVRDADRIYVMARGRVTEQGTHDELMALGGHYAEMFTVQAAGYLEPRPAAAGHAGTPRARHGRESS